MLLIKYLKKKKKTAIQNDLRSKLKIIYIIVYNVNTMVWIWLFYGINIITRS